MKNDRQGLFILYLCVFFSGAVSLAYEVLWTRLLGLTFGHTVHALTTVLAAFMVGLALGNYLLGRVADRWKNPVRLYGYLELIIGLFCLAVPDLLTLARNLYLLFYPNLVDLPSVRLIVQFTLSGFILIIPTTLMGGTLPVLSRTLVRKQNESGRAVALIYGINTLGAGVGAFLAGYWLLPAIGNRATNTLGGAINILIGICVFLYLTSKVAYISKDKRREPSRPGLPGLKSILLLGITLSGAASISYQVAWVRALILVIGSSTYAVTAILVTFLGGIALGSLLFPKIKNAATPQFFAFLMAGIALSALLVIPIFNYLPRAFLLLFEGYTGDYNYIQFIQFIIVAIVVILPTTFMGLTIPCLVAILNRDVNRVGSDVGKIFALNTIGAVIGAVLAGFLLIPHLGAQKTITINVALNLTLASAVLIFSSRPRWRWVFPLLLLLLVGINILPAWNKKIMISGVSIYSQKYKKIKQKEAGKNLSLERDILYFREGTSSTVAVDRDADGITSLVVNGKYDASNNANDMETQVKLAYIPSILHPHPRKIAVIGLGSGVTAGIATLFSGIQKVTIIEIEPAVLEASDFFLEENFNVLNDRKSHVVEDDGRSYLEGTDERYDVIISETSNPWIEGISNLYTSEFFRTASDKLSNQGIFSLWFHGYSISPETFKMIIRTFQSVFPQSSLWRGGPADYILVGVKGSIQWTLSDLIERIRQNETVLRAINRYGDSPVEGLFANFVLDSEELLAFAGMGPIVSDNHLLLEFLAPKSLYDNFGDEILTEVLTYKKRNHPSFVEASELQTPESHMRLAHYLLFKKGLTYEANWQMDHVFPLLPFQKNPTFHNSTQPSDDLRIDFEGRPSTPVYPRIGAFKPESDEEENLRAWESYRNYFIRTSGMMPGSGLDNSVGLVLNSLENINFHGFAVPLSVRSETKYTVDVWILNPSRSGIVGVGLEEYDDLEDQEKQFTRSYREEHQLDRQVGILATKSNDWRQYSFTFQTSGDTRMVHLLLYREKTSDSNPVVFDRISIKTAQ